MKIGILLLIFSMLSTQLSACTPEIPSIPEAKRVVDAYVHYHQTGEIPEDIKEVLENYTNNTGNEQPVNLSEILKNTPAEILENTVKKITKSDVLSLAEQYYNMAYPHIEADTKSEYGRLVSWEPDFSGRKLTSEELELQKHSSINVALSLSYTNAKNFYLAMAATVFGKNPDDVTAAGNFAGALAAFADDSISEGTPTNKVSEFYEHAEKVYHYALLLAGGRDAQYTQEALPLLVSLGNLYLDSSKYEEAYGCFQAALEINKGYSPAAEGLYNTYMALKQYKKALELVAETTEYPAFISANKKVSQRLEEDAKKPGLMESTSDEETLQLACDSLNTVESISLGDYLGEFDQEAQKKLNKLVLMVQNRMKYKAPDIVLISQYSNLRAISEPMGESALEAFSEGMDQYVQKAEELQEKTFNEENSEDTARRISEYAMQYRRDRKYDTLKLFYQAMSELYPEFSVFTLNPYEYTNPLDIVVQRQNINLFNRKYLTYSGYLGVANSKVIQKTDEIVNDCHEKVEKLWDDMNTKLENLDDDASASQVHAIHTNYYPKINNAESVAWQQATQITVSAYQKKIKKYAKQMYNDCMKHVILISDDAVRQKLEEKLQGGVMSALATIYNEIYRSFSFVRYTGDCGCDEKAMRAQQEAEEKERERLANEQIKKNMEAKKRFETGELDENSEYYKKIIKPYEVKINSPFVEGVVGPYKSGFQVKIELPGAPPVIEFGKMENHIRNTTTYNGGIEFGAGPVKTYLKFSATKDANGSFSADDVDVVGGGNVSFSKAFANIEIGMEASAVRGTKTYANFSASGDDLLNEEFKSYMGNWSPDLSKELWNGDYPMN